jgi:hypothetical protein
VIQLSSQPVGYLAARGDGVTRLLSVDLTTGEVRIAVRPPSSGCHYQLAGPSTSDSRYRDDGSFLVWSGRGCGRPMVLSMTRERILATFDLPAVEQAATACTKPDCDGPTVSVAEDGSWSMWGGSCSRSTRIGHCGPRRRGRRSPP